MIIWLLKYNTKSTDNIYMNITTTRQMRMILHISFVFTNMMASIERGIYLLRHVYDKIWRFYKIMHLNDFFSDLDAFLDFAFAFNWRISRTTWSRKIVYENRSKKMKNTQILIGIFILIAIKNQPEKNILHDWFYLLLMFRRSCIPTP